MNRGRLHYIINKPSAAVKILAGLIFFAGIYIVAEHFWVATIFLVLGILPFIMHKCVEFRLYDGVYSEGYCIAGKTIGKAEPFPGVDSLFLKKNRYKHVTRGKVAESVSWRTSFDGYIHLSDGTKILIVEDRRKENALQQLRKVSQDFEVEIRDFT